MTYDWNKQVEITVPTGTNGWIYSGEVIINGVKVRFPVGVPTTVPEPAAALLNKMIELEREDENNTAKPDNHYVGSVTITEGKTLTLAKGAKVVDEDGVLGGSSTTAPVVILPETEMTKLQTDGVTSFYSATPLKTKPEYNKRYIVTYNGVVYDSTSFDLFHEGDEPIVIGNPGALMPDMDNGNPEPFVCMLYPSGNTAEDGTVAYCAVMPGDGATSVTLSIVEAAKTESAGGGGITLVKVSGESSDMQTFTNVTCDKKFADLKSVYDADGLLWCRLTLTIDQGDAKLEMVAECPLSGYDKTAEPPYFMFNPIGTLSSSGIAVQLDSEDNCKIFID